MFRKCFFFSFFVSSMNVDFYSVIFLCVKIKIIKKIHINKFKKMFYYFR